MAHLSRSKTFLGAVALLGATAAIAAEQNQRTDGAERCIQISRIDHTHVVDDQNILFYLRGGKVYNNHLPQRCNSLSFGNAFKYATSQSQLCNVDIISVIDSSTGAPLAGAACGLGLFVPIEPKSADKMH